jgi:DNA-binding transcriptional ArsR family regulator
VTGAAGRRGKKTSSGGVWINYKAVGLARNSAVRKSDEPPDPIAKAILVFVAGFANTQDKSCYPGIRRIVRDTDYSEKAIRLALKRLEDGGFIRCARRGRQGYASLYVINELRLLERQLPKWKSKARRRNGGVNYLEDFEAVFPPESSCERAARDEYARQRCPEPCCAKRRYDEALARAIAADEAAARGR